MKAKGRNKKRKRGNRKLRTKNGLYLYSAVVIGLQNTKRLTLSAAVLTGLVDDEFLLFTFAIRTAIFAM
jgi:hypothetical protein